MRFRSLFSLILNSLHQVGAPPNFPVFISPIEMGYSIPGFTGSLSCARSPYSGILFSSVMGVCLPLKGWCIAFKALSSSLSFSPENTSVTKYVPF